MNRKKIIIFVITLAVISFPIFLPDNDRMLVPCQNAEGANPCVRIRIESCQGNCTRECRGGDILDPNSVTKTGYGIAGRTLEAIHTGICWSN